MCAECDRYGGPMNSYCRSVAETKSIQESMEREKERQEQLNRED